MKLALVTHSVVRGDGQGRVNYEIARHCLARGEEVWLLADRVAPELIEQGAKWIELHPRFNRPILAKVWDFARLADRAAGRLAGKVDVMIANGFTLRTPHTVNISHMVHGAWARSPFHASLSRGGLYGLYQSRYTALNCKFEKQSYGRAKALVAVSSMVGDDLQSIGEASTRISVIPNGVDLDEFHPGKEDRAALGLPANGPLALFVGEIRSSRKNLDTVLKALVHVKGLQLVVAGAVARSPYPQMARDLGISERVTFLDYRKDIAQLMRACNMFVFPSHFEPFGLVILEALASGCPVITAKSTGAADIVTEDCGIVIDRSDDVKALAAAMDRMATDAAYRERLAGSARRVAEEHSWTQMADRYLKLFKEVA